MVLDPDGIGAILRHEFPWTGPTDVARHTFVTEDDCAVLEIGGVPLVLTSDYVNANPISVTLGLAGMYDLGRYLVGANIADLCGTLAAPVGILLNVVWPRDEAEERFSELLRGVQDACSNCGIGVLGGDTKLGPRLVLNAAAIGIAQNMSELALQSRARVGDDVWVSGPLGSCSAAAYALTELELHNDLARWARARILRPELPLAMSRGAAALRLEAAGCDISDGLGADLASICNSSGVGVEVEVSAVPFEPQVGEIAAGLGIHPAAFAFAVGGDMQSILVTRPEARNSVANEGYVRIGSISRADRTLIASDGTRLPFPAQGHRDVRGLSFPQEIAHLLETQGVR